LPGIVTAVGRCDGRVAFSVRDAAVLMAAMRLVEIVLSRPSANGAQAEEQDRSDEAPRKCIALPLLTICSNFCSASKAASL
jgi:hypothetical protein